MPAEFMAVAFRSPAAVRLVAGAALTLGLAYAPCAYAQTRPVPPIQPPVITPPIEPPVVRPPINPPITPPINPPITPPIATPDVRIVTDSGLVVGTIGRASAELPPQAIATPSTSTSPTPRTTVSTAPVYRWTIVNGKLLSDPADSVAEFTAGTTGTMTLSLTVTADGSAYNTSARITVMPPNVAGMITVASPIPASTVNAVTATVPAAVSNDRTFRWSVSEDARIVRGQGSSEIVFLPGGPGTREISCVVTLQNLGPVTLRSYVTVTGHGDPVEVTINDGSGGGSYPPGSRVPVLADPPAAGMVFDRWVGDVGVLGDDPLAALLPQGTLTVPAAPAVLTATYLPVSIWAPSVISDLVVPSSPGRSALAVPRALYHLPPEARGLVLLLHDTGGTAADWFERPDQTLLVRDLVAAGLGVAAFTSASRTWSTQPTLAGNPDAQGMVAVLDKLVRDDGWPASHPLFVFGLGAGAQAAARAADLLREAAGRPVTGVILGCGAGLEDVAALSRVPALFAVGTRDASPGYAGATAARTNANLLAGRGIAANILETGVTPVGPRRLRKLGATDSGFTAEQAAEIWTALRSADVLDANGYVKQILSADAIRAALPASVQRHAIDVAAQLQLAAGGRGVASESSPRIVHFINQRSVAEPVPEPGRITNISTRSRIAFAGDAFGIGFSLVGSEPAIVLVRAVGPGLGRFGVAGRCLATRLEVYRGSTLVAANEGWDENRNRGAQIADATAALGAFPLAPGALDGAALFTAAPGAYQVLVKGVNGTTGDVLVEAYDVSRNATRFARFGALARIDDVATESVVTGFVVQGGAPRTLLLRTLGPGLTQLGRPADGVMPDPAMVLMSGSRRVGANDNWSDGNSELLRTLATRAAVSALAAGSRDAALLGALPAGAFIVEASGGTASPAPGEVLIEVAEVP